MSKALGQAIAFSQWQQVVGGAFRGAVVACVLCSIEETIFVKLSFSLYGAARPAKLVPDCPVLPDLLAFVALRNLAEAERCWVELCAALEPFRTTGKGAWFRFKAADKPIFNANCAQVFAGLSSEQRKIGWGMSLGAEQIAQMVK